MRTAQKYLPSESVSSPGTVNDVDGIPEYVRITLVIKLSIAIYREYESPSEFHVKVGVPSCVYERVAGPTSSGGKYGFDTNNWKEVVSLVPSEPSTTTVTSLILWSATSAGIRAARLTGEL
jgi:hypothetical protein